MPETLSIILKEGFFFLFSSPVMCLMLSFFFSSRNCSSFVQLKERNKLNLHLTTQLVNRTVLVARFLTGCCGKISRTFIHYIKNGVLYNCTVYKYETTWFWFCFLYIPQFPFLMSLLRIIDWETRRNLSVMFLHFVFLKLFVNFFFKQKHYTFDSCWMLHFQANLCFFFSHFHFSSS